ncbi:hypothetical protein SEA_EULA_58 [Microbacterium phage Eula]|uniref:hypothetical protein n=1 Tax=Microbacterium phage Eula TaxID=2926098 RepID=UPI00220F808C|nr:hypothetical protein QDW40_gp58 [Microbacterium phage Eula]UVF61113.1 hypothetical protein SEA_EULA_58 [Microbacterium phage Eula]
MTTIEPTPIQVAAFKKAWHKANDAGLIGERTEAGLRAALNPPTEFDLLEPGFYVTANNVRDGKVNEGAVLMTKSETLGWRIETAVSYQRDSNVEDRIREWFDGNGLARVELVPHAPAVATEPKPEVYAIDCDGDRWEPVHATDLWHCVDEPMLDHRTTDALERTFEPVTFYGLN